ncbi:Cl-channel protein [Gautieria morchelliformis]|nr:Cl-channel protein [Gautieria morchelliformis]
MASPQEGQREALHGRQFHEELEEIRRYEDFSTIDWIEDSMIERNLRLRKERQFQSEQRNFNGGRPRRLWTQIVKAARAGQGWFVITLAGVCIGINAAIISIVTSWLSDIKMGYCRDAWWLNRHFCCWEVESTNEDGCSSWRAWGFYTPERWIIYVLCATMFSLISASLVKTFARYAAGSGISEIKCIIAGFIMQGYLGGWTLFIKSLTLPLVIASGLSVGKEGPSVHVACCIGNIVARMFSRYSRSQEKMREILTAASAAGVAVAFGSPIGGVLFSVEEMCHTFSIKTMWRSFFCALVATVTLSAMNPFRTGKLVLFQVTYDRDWHFFEIVFFVIIGIFGGLYGAFVIKFNLQVAAFRRRYLANHGVAEAVTLATLTSMFGYFNRFIRIDMTESLAILFRECDNGGDYDNLCQSGVQWRMANSLLLATIFRVGFVVLSYGCKVPAGIFIPSMAVGATFGRMIGIIVKAMYRAYPQSGWFAVCRPDVPCITPGTYAFLGAAAALGGVMRITVCVVVIMFELTGALTYILPTMIVLLVTKSVGDFFGGAGIADEMIRFNGYPLLEKNDHAFNLSVSRVMRKHLHTLTSTGMTVADVETVLERSAVQGYPIISGDGRRMLEGYIGRTEIQYILEKMRRSRDVSPQTCCAFTSEVNEQDDPHLPATSAGPALGIDEDEAENLIERSASETVINMWPWVNQTPLTVSPRLPLEIVMQLFKRMGPRVILVEELGSLIGLITVKDVLKFIAIERGAATPSWNDRRGLDVLLGEAWMWISQSLERCASWTRSLFRRS